MSPDRIARHLLLASLASTAPAGPRPVRGSEPAKPTREAVTEADVLHSMLTLHNTARRREGLPPFVWSTRLEQAARAHARDMALRVGLDHNGADGSNHADRIRWTGFVPGLSAENIAIGAGTAREAVDLWLGSSLHHEHIMRPCRMMGAAYSSKDRHTICWVAVFADPIEPGRPPRLGASKLLDAIHDARAEAGRGHVEEDPILSRLAERTARELTWSPLPTSFRALATRLGDEAEAGGHRSAELDLGVLAQDGSPAAIVEAMTRANPERGPTGPFRAAGVGVASQADGLPIWVVILTRSHDGEPNSTPEEPAGDDQP